MNAQIELLQQQLDKQKKRLNKLMLLAALLLLILSSQFLFSFREYDGNKVLRARGIVIVDDEGRERILIGAPLARCPQPGTYRYGRGKIIVGTQSLVMPASI